MTTLADIRARVRQDLHDEDSGAYLWTDNVLDRHLAHAINDYSLDAPQEQKSTLTTTAGSRDISVASLTDLIAIERVEWPAGEFPPRFVGFSQWQDTITLDVVSPPAGVEDVNVYWTKKHAVSGTLTLPAEHEDLVAAGAVGYAALDRETLAINKINLGGDVWGRYAALGKERLDRFRAELRRLGRNNTVRQRRMYSTDAPAVFEQGRVKY
jgi:hypothetical protein